MILGKTWRGVNLLGNILLDDNWSTLLSAAIRAMIQNDNMPQQLTIKGLPTDKLETEIRAYYDARENEASLAALKPLFRDEAFV